MFQNIYHFHGHQTSWSPIPSINNVHIATIGWANSSGLPWARSLNNVWSIGKSWTSPMTHLLQYSSHFIGNLKWFSKHIFYDPRNPNFLPKGCLPKKKIAEKETLVHMGGRGVKKNPLFLVHQKGDIFLWGEGSKSFCLMSHVHFCASVSTQFEAFLEALHYGNFLYLLIK